MDNIVLNFVVNEKDVKWKKGRFEIENLQVLGDSLDDFDVEYDKLYLFLDDKRYNGGISTWSQNSVSAYYIFYSTFNAYLRNSKEFSFGEEWDKVFGKIKNSAEEKDGILTKFIQMSTYIYELDLAVSGFRYYYSDGNFLMLDDSGRIITDVEDFYMNGLYETICDIIKGKEKILCKGETNSYDYYIKEYTEEGFLKEFDH